MNFIKLDRLMASRLLMSTRNDTNFVFKINTRTLFTLKMNLNANNGLFCPQKHCLLNEYYFNHHLVNGFVLNPMRCLSKGRDKPKEKRKTGKPKVILTDEEMNELIPINELRIELNKVIEKFKNNLISNVNVRSSSQSLDHLVVEISGVKHNLNEIANISRKSPQLVVLNMSSMPEAIKPVLTAIAESGMNLSPQQEGNVIYLPIPKVTREHREGLAINAKTLFQKAKDELKDIQNSFTSYVKKQKKANVSEELIFNVNENLKQLIDTKVQELELILDKKLTELLN